MGCLTESTWILKFRFDTLIPNINWQTFWPKVMSHVTNRIQSYSLFNISHFSSTCCAKTSSLTSCPTLKRKGCRSEKEKKKAWQNRNLQRWTCLLMFRQDPHPRRVRLHPRVRGYSLPRGNLKAGWEEIQNPTQRRVLKRDCKMRILGGLIDKATGKPVASNEGPGDVDLSESETGSEENVTGRPAAYKTAPEKTNASS